MIENAIRKWLRGVVVKVDIESIWIDQKYYLTIQIAPNDAALLEIHSASLGQKKQITCSGGARECTDFYLNAIAEFERETVAMNKSPRSKVVEAQEIGRSLRAVNVGDHYRQTSQWEGPSAEWYHNKVGGEVVVTHASSFGGVIEVEYAPCDSPHPCNHRHTLSGGALRKHFVLMSPKAVEEVAGSTKEVRENQIGRFLPPGWDGRIGNFLLDWFDGKFRNNASAVLLIEDKDNLRNFSIAILNSSGVGTTAAEVKICGSNPVHLRQFPVGAARSTIHGWISEKIRELGFPPTPTPFREDGQDVLAAPQQSWVEQLYHDRLANKDRDCPPLDALGKPLQKPVPPPAPPCETVMDTLRLDTIGAMSKHVHDTKVAIKHLQEDLVIYERQLEEKIRGKCPDHPI